MSSISDRKFMEELSLLLQKNVVVKIDSGKSFSGTLSGVDTRSMSLCLSDAKDESGKIVPKLFLMGGSISEIMGIEKPFDLRSLADRLERVFPRMVKVVEEAGVIVVMEKIRLSEKGIIEGSGPAAERVQRVYDEFMKEATKTG
jgi:small nuclear ribonucleoprotein (snRNP)-like protein